MDDSNDYMTIREHQEAIAALEKQCERLTAQRDALLRMLRNVASANNTRAFSDYVEVVRTLIAEFDRKQD